MAAAPRPLLRLSLLGTLRAGASGAEEAEAALRLRSRKARAVLGYLALSERGEETRERLVGLLWSESEEEKARASLRQVVHELREAMEAAGLAGWLRAERLAIALDPAGVAHDLGGILAAAEAGAVHPALLDTQRLPETLLEGLDDLDPAFRVWLLARRQAIHDRLMRALEPLLRGGEEGTPASRARRRAAAQAVLRLDPTHEEACRALMAASAAEGDVAAALRAYEQLWRLLGDEYDMEPSAATQELVAAIKSGRFEQEAAATAAPGLAEAQAPAPLPAAAAAARPEPPARIALLVEPFSVNGVPPDRMHLVNGFRHELIARLVRFREWAVVDGPALPPGGPPGALRTAGLYAITATAYQAGARISTVLTLADRDSGVYVWSERVELSLEGWFEAQQRILRRVAASLNGQLSAARLARLAGSPDLPHETHDRWLLGQSLILSFGADNWERAVALLEETVARTPDFAPAHSSLAQLHNIVHFARPGLRRDRAREEAALRHARRAVQLDPTDSRSQLCMGWSLAMAGRHAQGEVHMRLALELNPDDAWTLMSVAHFRSFTGAHQGAMELAQQSMQITLAPSRTHWAYLAVNAFLSGEHEMAVEACERSEGVILTMGGWRTAALAMLGRRAEAAASAARFLAEVRAAWRGAEAPTDAAILRWLLHAYPIRHAADWARLRDGLAAAGLRAEGAAHGAWYAPAAAA